jgi:uncharacterized membrane protein
MKAYLVTTGVLFVIVTAMHVMRAVEEPDLARAPWFVLLTLGTAVLSIWALRLYQKSAQHKG